MRKINELVKRVRLGKVHAYVISNLKEQMPMLMGHAKKQKQLIDDLPKVFRTCMKRYNLAPGDFPDLEAMRSRLVESDFSKFNTLKQRLLDDVETVLSIDLPRLMKELPQPPSEQIEVDSAGPLVFEDTFAPRAAAAAYAQSPAMATASALPPKPSRMSSQPKVPDNPWGADEDDDFGGADWSLAGYIPQYQPTFNSLQKGGLVSGGAAKPTLQASGLPAATLRKIWDLSDIDKDGSLDLEEFVLINMLVELVRGGAPVPEYLDADMIPPSKRR